MAEVWRRGSVVGSWLVDLTADAFARSPGPGDLAGRASVGRGSRYRGGGRRNSGPAAVITAALTSVSSPGQRGFTDKILSAMRSEFGGHAEKKG